MLIHSFLYSDSANNSSASSPANATEGFTPPSNATSANPSNGTAENTTSSENAKEKEKLQSIAVKAEKSFSIRKRRSLDEDEESDGVRKMAARGDQSQEANAQPMKRSAKDGKSFVISYFISRS